MAGMCVQASLRELTVADREDLRICVISSIAILFVALAIVAAMASAVLVRVHGPIGFAAELYEHFADLTSGDGVPRERNVLLRVPTLLRSPPRRAAGRGHLCRPECLLMTALLDAGQPFYGYGSMVAAAIDVLPGVHRTAARAAMAALPRLHHQQHFICKEPLWRTCGLASKVVVTGAGGFIGSHLTEALVAAGAEVTAMVRYNSSSLIGNLAFLDDAMLKAVRIVSGNIEDSDFMYRTHRGPGDRAAPRGPDRHPVLLRGAAQLCAAPTSKAR